MKSHDVVNFRTKIRSGQSEERTTFSTCEKHRSSNQRPRTMFLHYSGFPATCHFSAAARYSTRFLSRKVVVCWTEESFSVPKVI